MDESKKRMTRRQHYIPQFYLRYFLNDKGKVQVYDRLKDKIFSSVPKNICWNDCLYETPWENASSRLGEFVLQNEIEKNFSSLEGKANTVLKRIINICEEPKNKNALICNSEDKMVLCKFVVNMLLRNPWSLEQAKVDKFPDEVIENKEVQSINQLFLDMEFGSAKSLIKAANKKVWLDGEFTESVPEQLTSELLSLNFSVLSSDKAVFVTSSFPVLYDTYDTEDGITHPKMIYMPIHPHFAVLYTNNSIVRGYRNRKVVLPENDVNRMNQLFLRSDIDQVRFIISNNESALKTLVAK